MNLRKKRQLDEQLVKIEEYITISTKLLMVQMQPPQYVSILLAQLHKFS
jgi:hypothetical protein